MRKYTHLCNLRVKFALLNMDYKKKLRGGEPLQELKAEIDSIETEIKALEADLDSRKRTRL